MEMWDGGTRYGGGNGEIQGGGHGVRGANGGVQSRGSQTGVQKMWGARWGTPTPPGQGSPSLPTPVTPGVARSHLE